MKKKFAVVGIGTFLTLTSLAGGAHASANESDCNLINGVCMWADGHFSGGMKPVTAMASTPRTTNITGDFNDLTSSWKNTMTSRDARWFFDADGKGDSRCMNSLSKAASMSFWDNDEASSVTICTDPRAC